MFNYLRIVYGRTRDRWFSFNSKYRPVGVITEISKAFDEFEIYKIQEEKILVSCIDNKLKKYVNFPHFKDTVTNFPMYLLKSDNARVIYNDIDKNISLITVSGKLIADNDFLHNGKTRHNKKDLNIFKKRYYKIPLKYSGNTFSFISGGYGTNNYFHWLFDFISRLYFLEKTGFLDIIDYYIVPPLFDRDFQRESLKIFDIKDEQIIYVQTVKHIEAEILFFTSHPRNELIDDWICRFLQEKFLHHLKIKPENKKLLYISRRDTIKRGIINEDELIDFLKGLNFSVVTLNGRSIKEQAALFNGADFIISLHGASLANLVFCNSGTRVLEIFPKNYVYPLYCDIANKMNLDYHFYLADTDKKTRDFKEAQSSDIFIRLSEFKPVIRELLKNVQ